MLNYNEFKEAVLDCFMAAMGDEYSDYNLQSMPVKKRGKELDGITVYPRKMTDEKTQVMPTIYINDLFKRYVDTDDFFGVVHNAAESIKAGIVHGKSLVPNIDRDKASDSIIFQLVNKTDNESYLNDVPHRDFLDLAVIYRWVIEVSDSGVCSTMIDWNLAEYLSMNEEMLFEKAYENTKRILPAHIVDMDEVIYNIFARKGMTRQETDIIANQVPRESRIYVLTNSMRFVGAGVILYDDMLLEMTKRLGSDIYVIPISVNEVMVTSVNGLKDPKDLACMLQHTNTEFEDIDDKLSENVYLYSASNRRLSIASVACGKGVTE